MDYRPTSPWKSVRRNLAKQIRPNVHITDPPSGAIRERDTEIVVRDGTVLRADVFRPETDGRYPVLLFAQPYGEELPADTRSGKGLNRVYRMSATDVFSTHSAWTSWEAPDPAFWVPRGYVLINVDLRGWGKSDGVGEILNPQEGEDVHDAIEWAAAQPWSNGKIGMTGVSYLAITQWEAAATRPPHLAAINPWEGFTDLYRDLAYPGGIRENGFMNVWSAAQRLQRPKAPSFRRAQKQRPLLDEWFAERSINLERIDVPALVCASFSDHSLHSRGAFEGFRRISSSEKWLYTHRGPKWAVYYSPEALALQARFFDHFLRGDDTGIVNEPPVRIEVREGRTGIAAVHSADRWPPAQVEPLALHLNAADQSLRTAPPTVQTATDVSSDGLLFRWQFDHETDVVGPMRLRLSVSADTSDVTVFAGVRKFHQGREVVFEGSYGYSEDIVTRGWLRASHRAVDESRSTEWEAWHPHNQVDPIPPGTTVDLDLTLLPSATRFDAGDVLVLEVRDRWFFPANPILGQFPAVYERAAHQRWSIHNGGSATGTLTVPVWRGAATTGQEATQPAHVDAGLQPA